ncbi:MAG: hypothetical protein K2F99_04855 [Muribaculaceae bacterium]|nr:hypothetical protein [Muribaculaceae bacterium]
MSKRKGGDFQNEAARRWRNMNKVPHMRQRDIYNLLDKEIDVILDQVTASRKERGKQFPDYVANGFANLSTALWFYNYVHNHVDTRKDRIKTDLTSDQIQSLLAILADVYSKSQGSFYQNQVQEFEPRNRYISKAFIAMMPRLYRLTGMLDELSKEARRDLTIQIYGDPVYKFKYVHRIINESTSSDKRKLKFLKRAYGERYIVMVGAAMTTEGNGSDCLAMVFDDMSKSKKKRRALYIQSYAEAYKKNGPSRYFRMDRSFYDKNKKLIKLLIGTKKHPNRAVDIGYRKAFKDMKAGKAPDKSRDRKDRRPLGVRRDDHNRKRMA